MAHCAVSGCGNQLKNNKNVSYHKLPANNEIAAQWISNLRRDNLPKNIFVCSDHFEEKYFDTSHYLKKELLPDDFKSTIRKKLLRGAVPTLFVNRESPGSNEISSNEINEVIEEQQTVFHNQNAREREDECFVKKVLISIACQTDVTYTREASTSTLLLERRNRRSVATQVNLTNGINMQNQYPSPKKRTKKYTRYWNKSIQNQTECKSFTSIETNGDLMEGLSVEVGGEENIYNNGSGELKEVDGVDRWSARVGGEESDDSKGSGELKEVDGVDRLSAGVGGEESDDCKGSGELKEDDGVDRLSAGVGGEESDDSKGSGELNDGDGMEGCSYGETNDDNVETCVTMNDIMRACFGGYSDNGYLEGGLDSNSGVDFNDIYVNTNNLDGCVNSMGEYSEEWERLVDGGVDSEDDELNQSKRKKEESDYEPDFDEQSDDESEEDDVPLKEKMSNEKCFLVYEEELYKLLRHCPECGCVVDRSLVKEMQNTGSLLHLKFDCSNNCNIEWKSQSSVGSIKGVGNLFLACSIVFSGVCYTKFERLCWLLNLKSFSHTEFYKLKRTIVSPVIRRKWKAEKQRMINNLKDQDAVVLIGDGRCDSPGHCAKYCTYTVMDTKSHEVVDTVVVPVTKVKNSNCMEVKGFKTVVRRLIKENILIQTISTDKHPQVRNLLAVNPEFNHIQHQYDPWHIIKGLVKKINKFAKSKKAVNCLLPWVPSIVNHFWWSLLTCEKNADNLYERFTSVMFHIVNRHEDFPGNTYFRRCAHDPLSSYDSRSLEWLDIGSEAHEYIVNLLKMPRLRSDMDHLTETVCTLDVEVFNNLLTKYCPKQYHFQLNHMEVGAYLAALEHNFNSLREQDVIKNGPDIGKLKYKIAWRKPLKKFIPRKVKTPKRYEYLKIMMCSAYRRVEKGNNRSKIMKRAIMAPIERTPKEELIETLEKYKRF